MVKVCFGHQYWVCHLDVSPTANYLKWAHLSVIIWWEFQLAVGERSENPWMC